MAKYGIIVGSIRHNSFTRGVAEALVAGLPDDAEVSYYDISKLPLYNQDFDDNSPKEYEDFRKWVSSQDAFIIATPEHNRSIPAALKNALDVASRPWGNNVWAGKAVLPASQSIGATGGMVAHHILRSSLDFLDTIVMHQPELYISNSAELSNEDGKITNESTKNFLAGVASQFNDFILKNID